MRQHIEVQKLAARLDMSLVDLQGLAGSLDIRIVAARGERFIRLRDAGRMVRAIDGPTDPAWSRLPELVTTYGA